MYTNLTNKNDTAKRNLDIRKRYAVLLLARIYGSIRGHRGSLCQKLGTGTALWVWRHGGLHLAKGSGELPGPPALPFVGNLIHMFHPDLPVHFLELARRYGPIYRLRLGNKDVVVLNSSEAIREALMRKWSDFAGRPPSFIADLISLGGKDLSLGNYTPTWRLQRKLAHLAFQHSLRGDMERNVQNYAQRLCKVFRDYGGKSVDVAHDFSLHTCCVISSIVFGPLDIAVVEEMHNCMIELVETWGAVPVKLLDFLPILKIFPNPTFRHLLSCVKSRDAFVQSQMKKHQIQEQIHEELMAVVGIHREPTYSDRQHLPYLSATITETLRMRPSAPLALPHMTIRDTSVSGFFIPKGTTVIPNLYGAHHDEGIWQHPLEFRPGFSRFLEEEEEEEASLEAQRTLVPFSCGARVCLGEVLARMEAFLFLAHILRDFQILPSVPGELPDLRGRFDFLVHCKPFKVRLVPRRRVAGAAEGGLHRPEEQKSGVLP
nr:steroid 21-hydroxylase-like [Pogona vitticeps]